MEQQDAKSIVTLEQFLNKLEGIIGSFKDYVDTTNSRISKEEENVSILTKRIGDNNGNIKELTRDFSLEKNKLSDQISSFKKTVDDSMKSLSNMLEDYVKEYHENLTKNETKKEEKPAADKAKKETKPKENKKTN